MACDGECHTHYHATHGHTAGGRVGKGYVDAGAEAGETWEAVKV